MTALAQSIVVALGGNALVRAGEDGGIATQFRNARSAMCAVVPLVQEGHRVVVTHGNGFQVGHILIRAQEALGKAYALPLEVAVAESQGELGYLLDQALHNALAESGLRVPVVSVLTQVVVDENDPGFENPTKPVGPAFGEDGAAALRAAGFAVVEEPGRGWRKVVASPHPIAIADVEPILWLLERGAVVIAAGGGGIPVVRAADGQLRGVPAVIDKDRASALLAQAVGAEELVILTGEPAVYENYLRPGQRALRTLTPDAARALAREGHFPPGSMGPKVEAAVSFVEQGGRRAIITAVERLEAARNGDDGTTIAKKE